MWNNFKFTGTEQLQSKQIVELVAPNLVVKGLDYDATTFMVVCGLDKRIPNMEFVYDILVHKSAMHFYVEHKRKLGDKRTRDEIMREIPLEEKNALTREIFFCLGNWANWKSHLMKGVILVLWGLLFKNDEGALATEVEVIISKFVKK